MDIRKTRTKVAPIKAKPSIATDAISYNAILFGEKVHPVAGKLTNGSNAIPKSTGGLSVLQYFLEPTYESLKQ
jgi:hypothetical protein